MYAYIFNIMHEMCQNILSSYWNPDKKFILELTFISFEESKSFTLWLTVSSI